MKDRDGIIFLKWALPHLGMRWPGFRKVRKQVFKRIQRRITELGLVDTVEYRAFLKQHAEEWRFLDGLCRVSISRFYRDHALFQALQEVVLPNLARGFEDSELRCWCAGCAGGEEPYSQAVMWNRELASRFPDRRLRILATDTDEVQLERARQACYPPSALRELPAAWREGAFTLDGGIYSLLTEHRRMVEFRIHDVRTSAPPGPFHLVFCRNLAFTYFDESTQNSVVKLLRESLAVSGYLVIGEREEMGERSRGLVRVDRARGIYRLDRSFPQD